MSDRDTRAKQISTVTFWHVLFPIFSLCTVLFVLFVVFRFPDEAIPVKPMSLRPSVNTVSS